MRLLNYAIFYGVQMSERGYDLNAIGIYNPALIQFARFPLTLTLSLGAREVL